MNTHEIFKRKGLASVDNYPEIAQWAASRTWRSERELLAETKKKFGAMSPKKQMRVKGKRYRVWGDIGSDIDYGAIEQMNTVMKLPVAKGGAMMPDAHLGYAMPIGGVAALDKAVSPNFVGFDIACRVTLSILDITPVDFLAEKERFAASMKEVSRFGKGAQFEGRDVRDHAVMHEGLWEALPHLKRLKSKAQIQLGSSGGGNHFFDAMTGVAVADAPWSPLRPGQEFVAIMTHSGSRGAGHKMATHYNKIAKEQTRAIARGIPSGYEWLGIETSAGAEYLAVMGLMGRYAQACHHLIHSTFAAHAGVKVLHQWENHHNFAWVQGDGTVVHRKGATPADKDLPGIIPGTSGTPSYLVSGLGNEASLNSSSHGAGRPFSRSDAKSRHDEKAYQEITRATNVTHLGVARDETLFAYKDIERVMSLQGDLVKPIAKLHPEIVIMGGKSDDGD